ncbi:hypothetical protein PVAP13_2KG191555 [Panicum virgatum]|uniref:Uncharacterized protein n=1 Tax=Panicum virgatum TaxID=38727 RepID=A0A8T0W5E5_PANVG|nr:hypothetical protein PVAP13_2KG191555 [Panicum virgatum]
MGRVSRSGGDADPGVCDDFFPLSLGFFGTLTSLEKKSLYLHELVIKKQWSKINQLQKPEEANKSSFRKSYKYGENNSCYHRKTARTVVVNVV